MMSIDELDFQFLDEGLVLENDNGVAGSGNISHFFDLEPDNPLHGNDLNLASVLNPDDDNLASPTDMWGVFTVKSDVGIEGTSKAQTQTSPWHESDSGVSDATYVGSPEGFNPEENRVPDLNTPVIQENLKRMDVFSLEDFDVDIEYQDSPNVTALSPSTKINPGGGYDSPNSYDHDDQFVEGCQKQVDALEFFKSDSFLRPSRHVKVLNIQAATGITEDDRSKKNAIQARINREKKKAYIKSLEDEIKTLKSENTKLVSENTQMQRTTTDLEEEVDYLKSVLINSSALSGLLKNISNVKDVNLSATIVGKSRKRPVDDHSYNIVESVPEKRSRRINENLRKAGVCLHVSDGSACLEFCAHCAKLAHKSTKSSK